MDKEALNELLKRYLADECTDEERAFVEALYHKVGNSALRIAEQEIESDLMEVRGRLTRHSAYGIKGWMRYAAAAAILVMVTTVSIYFIPWKDVAPSSRNQVSMAIGGDIPPGGNRAILTLADGRTIDLSVEQAGIIIGDGIMYMDGSLVTNQKPEEADPENSNSDSGLPAPGSRPLTLSTPKGGQYQMILPDGTKVWLNAASSLSYAPTNTGKKRIVHLEGEAYFEVAKDENRPFSVITEDQVIEVLGTHFNINSYADEPVRKTVLLEGSVKVTSKAGNGDVVLKPGEQAALEADSRLHVSRVPVEDAIAWKNGLFRFDNTDIETIMRQLARWYDVEVVFEGKKPAIKLWGEVYRSVDAAQALEILTYFDLKYRIETKNGVKRIVIYS